MKKTNLLWIILDLIFLVIFNAVFFVAGGVDHNVSVWVSYGFIHFAYLMLLLTPALVRRGKNASVFGFSLYSVSSAYFLLELVVGVVFILISPGSYKAALLVQLCVAGIYGIALISNMIANEHTADAEEKRQYQIEYVKNASAELKGLLETVSDKDAKKKVEKVYDALYSSPVKSHPNLAQMESQILISVNELRGVVSLGEKEKIITLADSLLIAVNERNRQLKMFN
jgi:signal transduction histidine kinase